MNSDQEAKTAFDAAWEENRPGRCETCGGPLDAGNRCDVCEPEQYPEQYYEQLTCEGCGNMGTARSWPFVRDRQPRAGEQPVTLLLCQDCWEDYAQPHRCETCQRPISHPGTCADCETSLAEFESWQDQTRRWELGYGMGNIEP